VWQWNHQWHTQQLPTALASLCRLLKANLEQEIFENYLKSSGSTTQPPLNDVYPQLWLGSFQSSSFSDDALTSLASGQTTDREGITERCFVQVAKLARYQVRNNGYGRLAVLARTSQFPLPQNNRASIQQVPVGLAPTRLAEH